MTLTTIKTIALNRKAYHDYFIHDTFEAGIALTGTEIKSIRAGKVNLRDAFAKSEGRELWLYNAHISRYDPGSIYNHDPTRPRKLLLHRDQIRTLISTVNEKGMTIVPLKLYIKDGIAKVEIALAKGKKLYDKRRSILAREAEREMDRARKRR